MANVGVARPGVQFLARILGLRWPLTSLRPLTGRAQPADAAAAPRRAAPQKSIGGGESGDRASSCRPPDCIGARVDGEASKPSR